MFRTVTEPEPPAFAMMLGVPQEVPVFAAVQALFTCSGIGRACAREAACKSRLPLAFAGRVGAIRAKAAPNQRDLLPSWSKSLWPGWSWPCPHPPKRLRL